MCVLLFFIRPFLSSVTKGPGVGVPHSACLVLVPRGSQRDPALAQGQPSCVGEELCSPSAGEGVDWVAGRRGAATGVVKVWFYLSSSKQGRGSKQSANEICRWQCIWRCCNALSTQNTERMLGKCKEREEGEARLWELIHCLEKHRPPSGEELARVAAPSANQSRPRTEKLLLVLGHQWGSFYRFHPWIRYPRAEPGRP